MNYSMLIKWSDEDQAFLVFLPEWADWVYQPVTDGISYEEAARKGQAALDTFIEMRQREGQPLPTPHLFTADDAPTTRAS